MPDVYPDAMPLLERIANALEIIADRLKGNAEATNAVAGEIANVWRNVDYVNDTLGRIASNQE